MVLTRVAFQYPPRLNSYSLYPNAIPGNTSHQGAGYRKTYSATAKLLFIG